MTNKERDKERLQEKFRKSGHWLEPGVYVHEYDLSDLSHMDAENSIKEIMGRWKTPETSIKEVWKAWKKSLKSPRKM